MSSYNNCNAAHRQSDSRASKNPHNQHILNTQSQLLTSHHQSQQQPSNQSKRSQPKHQTILVDPSNDNKNSDQIIVPASSDVKLISDSSLQSCFNMFAKNDQLKVVHLTASESNQSPNKHQHNNLDSKQHSNGNHNSKPTSPNEKQTIDSSIIPTTERQRQKHKFHWVWQRESSWFRFFILFVAVLIPFGGHVVKYSLSALATPLLADKELGLSHAEYGSFQSAVSIPNLFVPFLGGLLLDLRDSRYGILLFLSLCTIGHTMFTLAIQQHSYKWAFFARIIFGLGQGSTVVAQSHIAATYFQSHELVLAVALSESMHNVSGLLSKVYVVPLSQWTGDYMSSLWAGVVICCTSLLAGCVYFHLDPLNADPQNQSSEISYESPDETTGLLRRHSIQSARQKLDMHRANSRSPPTVATVDSADGNNHSYQSLLNESQRHKHDAHHSLNSSQQSHVSSSSLTNSQQQQQQHPIPASGHVSPALSHISSTPSLTKSSFAQLFHYNQFTFGFVILCLLHLLFSNVYHLFDYISIHFLETKYHTATRVAAMYSSLTSLIAIFLCPVAGYFLDTFGGKMYVCVAASVCTTITYLLFIYTQITPIIPLLFLSLCVAFVPTILRSSVPDLISHQSSHECRVVLFATAYGVYEICESIGAVIGHTTVGYVVDLNRGDYTSDLWIFVTMSVCAFILCTSLCIWDSFLRPEGAVINLSTSERRRKLLQEETDYKQHQQNQYYSSTSAHDDELIDAESHNRQHNSNTRNAYGAV